MSQTDIDNEVALLCRLLRTAERDSFEKAIEWVLRDRLQYRPADEVYPATLRKIAEVMGSGKREIQESSILTALFPRKAASAFLVACAEDGHAYRALLSSTFQDDRVPDAVYIGVRALDMHLGMLYLLLSPHAVHSVLLVKRCGKILLTELGSGHGDGVVAGNAKAAIRTYEDPDYDQTSTAHGCVFVPFVALQSRITESFEWLSGVAAKYADMSEFGAYSILFRNCHAYVHNLLRDAVHHCLDDPAPVLTATQHVVFEVLDQFKDPSIALETDDSVVTIASLLYRMGFCTKVLKSSKAEA